MYPIKAKKSYGQHFLTNHKLAEKNVDAIEPNRGDEVLEIGPGKGVLTKILLGRGCRVTAVELDKNLVDFLHTELGYEEKLTIVEGDFIKYDKSKLTLPIKIIGNIPYNITKEILDKLFEFKNKLSCVVLTIQREIAEKLIAKPNSSNYGLLTVLMQSKFTTKLLFGIPRKSFSPPPSVSSKVIKLLPLTKPFDNAASFREFLRACFIQKRKTLVNSMMLGLKMPKSACENILKQAGLNLAIRQNELSIDEYFGLFNIWRELT
jgi:16S rRNA (adenine1518-N6/adenine1519-N6)-dimethyltransferase